MISSSEGAHRGCTEFMSSLYAGWREPFMDYEQGEKFDNNFDNIPP